MLFSVDIEGHFLFYHDKVYASHDVWQFNLPQPKLRTGVIWSLFDISKPEEPPGFLVNPPCFPVQTTSPDPRRYKNFLKVRDPIFTGLPLWTREELAMGSVLQSYISFVI